MIDPFTVPQSIYGTAWKEERTAQLVTLALRAGFHGIDTANQRKHYCEAGVGEALSDAYGAGVVTREELFLQTKFTYRDGQDHRLPYDPEASPAVQVSQSLASSLEHLHTGHVDSFLLHGPASHVGWTKTDSEVWNAMIAERGAGRTRSIGVSNVSLRHLEQLAATSSTAPAFVQNRCYASLGWDRDVRLYCSEHHIVYQGFSLLTANREVLRHPLIAELATKANATPAQIIFSFARSIGILPLTGTSDPEHMRQDLDSVSISLTPDAVETIEQLTG